jgi:hypothetical protein
MIATGSPMTTLAVAVPPLNTTFMGMLRGVCSSFGLAATDADLFGASGHGFLMNIHRQLCPSGPYCFDRGAVFELIQSLGIQVHDLGNYAADTPRHEKTRLEERIKAELDCGRPAGMLNAEFQLITGYDQEGFITSQPWPGMDFPPSRLSFGSWSEAGATIPVNFFVFSLCPVQDFLCAARHSLRLAVDVHQRPMAYSRGPFAMGPLAFQVWREALPEFGDTHGNWWNATVWSESRLMAARWLAELSEELGHPVACQAAKDYQCIGENLAAVGRRDLPCSEKMAHLSCAEARENQAIPRLEALARML